MLTNLHLVSLNMRLQQSNIEATFMLPLILKVFPCYGGNYIQHVGTSVTNLRWTRYKAPTILK